MTPCEKCGSERVRISTLPSHLERIGPYLITLTAAVEERVCRTCKWRTTTIPELDELRKAIALERAFRPIKLGGADITFLRTTLKMTGRDFAARFDLTPETVSRWEHSAKGIGGYTEKLVRYTVHALLHNYGTHSPIEIADMRVLDLDRVEGSIPPLTFAFRLVDPSATEDEAPPARPAPPLPALLYYPLQQHAA